MLRTCSATSSSVANALGTNSETGCANRHVRKLSLSVLGFHPFSAASASHASFLAVEAKSKTWAATSSSKFVSFMAVAFRGLLRNTQFIGSAAATFLKKAI